MEAIRTYLDNVFAAFPQTEQVKALKAEMLASMEEKYRVLKGEGKSEHEAVGSVIANFGSIEEIAAELGLEQGREKPQEGLSLSRTEAMAYLADSKKSGIWIGLGVWLILTGIAAFVFLHYSAGAFALFPAIAIAVVMFIVNDGRMSRYKAYEKTGIRLDARTRAEVEAQSLRFMKRFTVQISVGVVLIILAAGLNVGPFDRLIANLMPGLFLFVVGFSIFLFITAGTPKSAFDVLLGRGDYKDKAKGDKVGRIIGTVASVYWPIVVAIYLLWSFLGNAWGISWIVWPVAGALFGAVAGGVGVWFGTKEE